MENEIWSFIKLVGQKSPLVHNITNYVAMNNSANALLAIGASPVMAHAHSEVDEMVGIADSLVINIGTLDEYWSESMLKAAYRASILGKPWVLDPVGCGATSFRNELLHKLLQFKPSIIRGNASEIMALAKTNKTITKGVDSTGESEDAVEAARIISRQYQCVVCVSGAKDVVLNDTRTVFLENGHPLMTKVTGLGCSASAVIGAFSGVFEDKLQATTAAMALMGVAGELAKMKAEGPGTLQLHLIDKLYNITKEEFCSRVKISEP